MERRTCGDQTGGGNQPALPRWGMTERAASENGADGFWETEPGWVLLDDGDGLGVPFNRLTSMAMLICDDYEYERIVTAMRLAGCPVVNDAAAFREHDA
jgi:hypothetical protein